MYGSGGFTSYDDTRTRQQLSEWVDKERIPRVKIKIGESWGGNERRDLARAELAREVIGPDAELYVDANGGYSTGQAVRVADELAAIGVSWFEEPVSSQDLAGLAAVRRQVRPDVAAGEYSWSLADSARLIEAGRGRLPAARRDPVRRRHRVHPRRGPGGGAQPAGLRALRAEPARARRGGGAEPAARGVLPRPPADRAAVLRRSARPRGRRHASPAWTARAMGWPSRCRYGALPARLTPGHAQRRSKGAQDAPAVTICQPADRCDVTSITSLHVYSPRVGHTVLVRNSQGP